MLQSLSGRYCLPRWNTGRMKKTRKNLKSWDNAANELSRFIEKENYIADALTAKLVTIKDITTATGAVLIFDNLLIPLGDTPSEKELREIVKWLAANMQDGIYYTHRFPEIFYTGASLQLKSQRYTGLYAFQRIVRNGHLV